MVVSALANANWDHPRFRGEHVRKCWPWGRPMGSSPHPRGTPVHGEPPYQIGGIIPASAGNTHRQKTLLSASRDHPRIRGEHGRRHHKRLRVWGSSPHSRGTPDVLDLQAWFEGIIPAFAGNTSSVQSSSPKNEDHPRIRGEHSNEYF